MEQIKQRQLRNILLAFVILMWGTIGTNPVLAATSSEDLSKLVLSSNELTLAIGDSAAISAYGIYEDGTSEDLTYYADWKSEDGSIASVYNGTITAKAEGKATLIASYGSYAQTIQVEVTKKVKALTKDKQTLELRKGTTASIGLTATYTDNTTESVAAKADWSSTDESIATVLNGTVTGVAAGTVTITGTYGGKTVTVTANVEVAKRLDASQTSVSLLQNESQTITLTATYADGTTKEVTSDAVWSSSNEAVADVLSGTIKGYSAGTATITAQYGTKTVTIAVDVDKTQKLTVDEQNVFLRVDKTQQLTVTAVYPSGTAADVTESAVWSSSNEAVAYVSKGLITGIASGTATITAKYGTKTVQVTVNVEIVNLLEASSEEVTLSAGGTGKVTVKATYIEGTTEDVTSKAVWTSTDSTVAFAAKGTITAYKMGTAQITGTYGGKSVAISVSVDVPSKVSTSSKEINIQKDEVYYADLIASYADESEKVMTEKATWTSDDTSVVTVNKGVLTGVAYGTATVTAAYGGKSVALTVHVENVRRIEASSTDVALFIDESETIQLMATLTDGTVKDVAQEAVWSSTNEQVAYAAKGVITGYTSGTATVTAAYANQKVTIYVSVDQTKKLKASETSLFLDTDETFRATVTAMYPDGTTADVTSQAVWSTSNGAIATVYQGLITAEAPGTASITATYSNKSVTITVDVDVARHLDPSDDQLDLRAGSQHTLTVIATFADGSQEDVTSKAEWSSDNEEVAYVAKGSVAAYAMGEAVLTASYGGATVDIPVTVDLPVKIRASEEELHLDVKEEAELLIYARYSDNSEADITGKVEWSVKDDGIAEVINGTITGIATGSTTVTAQYGEKSVTIPVKVGLSASLEANVPLVTMGVSDTYQLVITAVDEDGNETNVTDKAVWKSSKAAVAGVKKGLVTAYSKGKANITATYGGQSVVVAVEVDQVARIEASITSASLKSGGSVKATVTVVYSDGNKKDVTALAEWKTSSYKIATVSGGVITAVGSGKTNITAKYAGKTVRIPVEVDLLKYLETSYVNIALKVGEQLQVQSTATYKDLSEVDVTKHALWTTSRAAVATAKDGLIKATGKGKASITVAYGDKKVKLNVIVS
ncbi:uncharacterized protein YjdB [Paenibacillus phyllosphaerae]|uniref:Uncharacterized protein YjdB n=1 Tax=Paenibacillus phyllosphaerae TaxID=274593 RepID=A0A7W5AUH2_9BACL|nr:Ig-like domain-containing protein [Paenibacillus phyllosphaerae]MBB3108907.1 uncharacterized protein YjdB [Paenibacillus phyllosphaerae]